MMSSNSLELEAIGSDKSRVAITTATAKNDVENGMLTSRHQRDIARETQKKEDEGVLARFGKKQQLTVCIAIYSQYAERLQPMLTRSISSVVSNTYPRLLST